jgi:DNA repair exonuclease SbcCD ATPase subunit
MNELSELFKLVAEDKKKKKEEFDSVVGDLGLDSLFSEFASLKKETKKKKIQEQKTVKAFENWLYSETTKEQEQIIEDVIEESLDEVLEDIECHKEDLEEINQPREDLIEKSLGLLAEPSNVKQKNDPITPLDQKFATLDDLHKHYSTFLSRIQQQLSTVGGGGETRLEFLDDVDRNSAKTDNYFLKYNSSINKWVGDPADGVGITSIVSISGVTTYYQATDIDDYIGVSADVPVTVVLPQIPSYGKN